MPMRAVRFITLFLLLGGLTGAALANDAAVLVISSERSAAYEQAAAALARELPPGQAQQLELGEVTSYRGATPRLYVALRRRLHARGRLRCDWLAEV